MRARSIGRARCMHNRQLILVKQWLEWREARMQSEKSVEVYCRVTVQLGVCKYRPRTPRTASRLRNRNRWPHAVIIWLAKRHNNVQSIRCAALKQNNKLLL